MNNEKKIQELERVIEKFLAPIKGIPFHIVIKAISGCDIYPFVASDEADQELLSDLVRAVDQCCNCVLRSPIRSRRANEVGNKMEEPVAAALRNIGLRAAVPTTGSGRAKSAGYPDLIIHDRRGRISYLEVKTYNERNANTTQRSFYVSPSEEFKVTHDAHHLLVAFQMRELGVEGAGPNAMRLYVPEAYKIVDIYSLPVDVKHEFNADNRRLYDDGRVIAQKRVSGN